MKTKILWFTGLSGSGKTTNAELLIKKLQKLGKSYKLIEGDVVRKTINKHLGFSPEDIKLNNKTIVELCRQELGKVDFVIVTAVSPFKESRAYARSTFGEDFVEIYLNCPYEECKRRNVKGLHTKIETGEIKQLIGFNIPYEPPETPEIDLDSVSEEPEQSANKVFEYLHSNFLSNNKMAKAASMNRNK